MKKIKLFAFIGMLTIAYVIGGIMGFAFCASTSTVNANPAPIVTSVQNTQSNIYTQTVYVDGQRYIVFTSGSSSMAVVKK
jgi:hypothetical protein